MNHPPICDYTGSDYQTTFWEQSNRAYEDAAEAIALRHLLPEGGNLLLEIGAGAGRNTPRYTGFERIVLLDYSHTQLEQAQARLGRSERYVYVAADAYRLPFADGVFDAATMIRTLHHMADAQRALNEAGRVLQAGGIFILEFANKRNLKAILRWLARRQDWNPFSPEPVEFAPLNFDFHPRAVFAWLEEAGFLIEARRTVSHFRLDLLKRLVPFRWLAALDGLIQPTGEWWQLTPSVFVRARRKEESQMSRPGVTPADLVFRCPACGCTSLGLHEAGVDCPTCGRRYAYRNGIYDFRVEHAVSVPARGATATGT